MRRLRAFKGLLVVVSRFISRYSDASHEEVCTSQWYVTSYFTPVEVDYPQAERIRINIEKVGDSVHATAFLKAVKIEGWGKTIACWYLGRFSYKWHRSNKPLNAMGKLLDVGSIATDNNIIPIGETLRIPSLQII